MEKWTGFVWQFFFGVLVIFFGGWMLGSLLNIVALANPQMVSMMFCPKGSTAVRNPAFGQSFHDDSAISCLTQAGASVPNLSDADGQVLQHEYFYKPGYITMIILVVGWFIWRSRKKQAD